MVKRVIFTMVGCMDFIYGGVLLLRISRFGGIFARRLTAGGFCKGIGEGNDLREFEGKW